MYSFIAALLFLALILTLIDHASAGVVFIFTHGGKITRFQATLNVPSPPTALQGHGPDWKIQATWAGMQPTDQSCVLQNVFGNAGGEVGCWSHIPSFYNGATKSSWTEIYFEERQPKVYLGDEITSLWTLHEISNKWLDTWSVMPGRIGASKGEVPYGGNYTFDGSKFEPNVPDMTEVLLVIEHVGTGNGVDPGWDSGAVTFTNILIESTSTKDWCNHENPEAWHPQDVKILDISTPFISTIGNGTKSCYIPWIVIDSN
ncbi:uncharacterized protein EAF01_000498 [Botrytis porri]|uniref:Uncharacterized protein n=1 Tax=Botrytis porri TaxID=87229 RepID=A0A4Z1KNZ7_9HELO|nr:uncharacterized protein EAF01_000498 [Botrytis porri]KAF7914092.1 hypothetical protein EAF01_000498 [Botrytis porri]TGO87220.1 hypothetical protein BPOR_0241g00050 [Botrytis porri]